jgi:hypothetical protein
MNDARRHDTIIAPNRADVKPKRLVARVTVATADGAEHGFSNASLLLESRETFSPAVKKAVKKVGNSRNRVEKRLKRR